MSDTEWTAADAVRVAAEEGGLYWISTGAARTAHKRRAMAAAAADGHLVIRPQNGALYAQLTDAGRVALAAARAEEPAPPSPMERAFNDIASRDTRIAELEATVERLRDHLHDINDVLGEDDEDFPDDAVVTIKFGRTTDYSLTLGWLRRVRAELSEPTP